MSISLIIFLIGIFFILSCGYDVMISINNKRFKNASDGAINISSDNLDILNDTLSKSENISKNIALSRQNTITILKAREKSYRDMLNSIGIAVLKFSKKGVCLDANYPCSVLFNTSISKLIKETYDVFTQLLNNKISLNAIIDELEFDSIVIREVQIKINSVDKCVRLTFSKMLVSESNVNDDTYLMCIEDITMQKCQEIAEKVLNKKLKTIMNSMPRTVFMFESDGTISERQHKNYPLNNLIDGVNNIFDVLPKDVSDIIVKSIENLDINTTCKGVKFSIKINDILYNYNASITHINSGINIFLMVIEDENIDNQMLMEEYTC